MERYVAFLRGMNLGGRRIKNDELRREFEALVAASKGKLQVALLLDAPTNKQRRGALDLATDDDRLAIDGRELNWLPSGGISESDLELRAIESALGVWTMRTMGTIGQIAAKHFPS